MKQSFAIFATALMEKNDAIEAIYVNDNNEIIVVNSGKEIVWDMIKSSKLVDIMGWSGESLVIRGGHYYKLFTKAEEFVK